MDPEARQGRRLPKPIEHRYLERQVREKRRGRRRAPEISGCGRAVQEVRAQYDLDYLLMAAQGYQESTLDQSVRSPVGAIGVMQVMPPTGKELKVGDITQIEPNIHAGVKYMRFMMDQYYKDEPMDNLNKALMTFAAYNAGPGRLGSSGARRRRGASIPTCGSATSSASPRSGSAAKRSPTSATSTSTTSPTD